MQVGAAMTWNILFSCYWQVCILEIKSLGVGHTIHAFLNTLWQLDANVQTCTQKLVKELSLSNNVTAWH